MPSEDQPPKFYRIDRVCEITGIPQSSIYAMVAEGKFPKQISLSPNRVAWLETDVVGWMHERIEASKPQRIQRRRGGQ